MKIEYRINGPIPEKEYTMIRRNGEIKQSDLSKIFETEMKLALKDTQGWTSKKDVEYGEYTPLQVILKIYTPYRPVLIKQIKATLDALAGAEIYANDCCIVDVQAERIYSDHEYAELLIQPAIKSNIEIPTGQCVIVNRHLSPIKANAFDEAGYPLNKDDREKDKELKNYIRQQFDEQLMDLIDGEFELTAHIGIKKLGVQLPLEERLAALNFERWVVTEPDVDNCAYALLVALKNYVYGDPEDLVKLHITKTFYESEEHNKIWIKERNNSND